MKNEKVNTSEKDVLDPLDESGIKKPVKEEVMDSLDESGTSRPVEEEEPDPTEKPLPEDQI